MSLREAIGAKIQQRQDDNSAQKYTPPVRTTDPELDAALASVERGEIAAAFRTRNGALVITHKSDPENSPAAPAAKSSGMTA